MELRRSGAPSRFVLFRSPETSVVLRELLLFNVLLGFLPFFGAVYALASSGWADARALFDPSDALHYLTHPPSPAVARLHRARVVRGELCLVTHDRERKSGTEDWHGTYAGDLVIAPLLPEGEGPPCSLEALDLSPASLEWVPRPVLHETETWRTRYGSLAIPAGGGRVLDACLRAGDRFFVDAPPVGVAEPALIAPGDGTPRFLIAEHAASRAGRASMLALAGLLVLLVVWRFLSARPIAGALVRRSGRPLILAAAPSALMVLLVTPLGLLAGLWCASHIFSVDGPIVVDRSGWAGAHFAVVACIIAALRMRDRRAELSAAMDLVQRGPRPPLDRARECEVFSIDVAVDPRAPVSIAPLTGAPRAHWAVETTRIFKSGWGYTSELVPAPSGPSLVRISGDAGVALLDLAHVAADLRAVRSVVRPGALRRGKYRDLVGDAWQESSAYVIEERFLDPGEGIHVIGQIVRFEDAGDKGRLPVLGGTSGEPVIVHAGSRRSLLRALAVERGFLSAAITVSVAAIAAIAVLGVYLGRL